MAFTTKEGGSQEFDLIPAGDYECVITNAETRQLSSGKQKVGFSLVIRNDVQQQCQNRYLFIDIWRKAESDMSDDDRAVDGFNFKQLCNVASAASLPTGQSFETLADFLRVLVGRCIRVTVKHSTYNGRTDAKIAPFLGENGGLHKTGFPECRHVMKQKTQSPAYGSVAPSAPAQYAPPQPQTYAPPTPPPLQNANLADFEEILQDGQLPF